MKAFKKIFTIVLCGLIFVGSLCFLNRVELSNSETVNVSSNTATKKCDVNDDGLVADDDLEALSTWIFRHLFLGKPANAKADFNGDGEYDMKDIVNYKKVLRDDSKPGDTNPGYTPPTPVD